MSCASISLNVVLVSQSFVVVSEDDQTSDVKAKQLADAVHRQMTVQRATRFLIPVGAVFVALGVVFLVVRRRSEHGND